MLLRKVIERRQAAKILIVQSYLRCLIHVEFVRNAPALMKLKNPHNKGSFKFDKYVTYLGIQNLIFNVSFPS